MVAPQGRWVGGLAALTLILAIGAGPGEVPSTAPTPDRAVGGALALGSFPWYDPARDAIKPLDVAADPEPPPKRREPSSGWGAGDWVAFSGFAVAIAALVGLLAWFWRFYEPIQGLDSPTTRRAGAGQVEALPEGLRRGVESSDPWAEALRRRDRGDLAGSVVCLFAHQLLALSRLGLVRIAPGRTGRQLLRAVADAEFRGLALPTLRMFEAVYYGHRTPTPAEFATLWAEAEAFERRLATRGDS